MLHEKSLLMYPVNNFLNKWNIFLQKISLSYYFYFIVIVTVGLALARRFSTNQVSEMPYTQNKGCQALHDEKWNECHVEGRLIKKKIV